ncbi:MAG TPA: hypothetical protein VJN70_14730 [Gemmatimonadaceae bacterium]|nr:hypothetical protein [Gemmatimonadaceae bacterium]
MKMLSSLEVQKYLAGKFNESSEQYLVALGSILVQFWTRLEALENATNESAPLVRAARKLATEFKHLREGTSPAAEAVGSNGQATDATQAEAERLMNQAAGPHPMSVPTGKRVPTAAAPTVGADGTPLDAAQSEAERQMNDAAGPRP